MFLASVTGYLLFLFTLLFLFLIRKWIIKRFFTDFIKTLFTDEYHENLMEILPANLHVGMLAVFENQLRSESGTLLYRPIGSVKRWQNLDAITFIPAQTTPFPIDKDKFIDLSQTIGKKAKKPLTIDIPIIVAGMAYGLAVSKEAKIALAKASAQAKTAINSGEGAVLPEERNAAHKYILQFSKSTWAKSEEDITSADMIEIKLGQGGLAGLGERIGADRIDEEAKNLMGLSEGEDAVIHERFFEEQTLADLADIVTSIRNTSGGVPIGVKIIAGGNLEDDLDRLIKINVDFIAVEGGQGGTHGAPPILQDDFGIPTLHAIVRAAKHLKKRKVAEQISLIAAGGLAVPGDFLKMIALGADAVYVGTSMLYAINHSHIHRPMPWEPPSQMVWSDSTRKHEFDIEAGATSGYNYLAACAEEMRVGLRAMGKTSLSELSTNDLVAYDETVAKMVGIPYSFTSKSTKKEKN